MTKRLNEIEEKLFLLFFEFFVKKFLKIEEKQVKENVEDEGIEEVVDSEGRES